MGLLKTDDKSLIEWLEFCGDKNRFRAHLLCFHTHNVRIHEQVFFSSSWTENKSNT